MKVLVLAPLFPSINQPWMDTYLEQLLANDFRVAIYTQNKKSAHYHPKVDQLKLKNYIIDFDLHASLSVAFFLHAFILNPFFFLLMLSRSIRIAAFLSWKYGLAWPAICLKLLRFGLVKNKFSEIDIIHSHSEVLAFEFLPLALMLNKPLVYTFHGLLPKGIPALAGRKRKALYGELDKVVVNTTFSIQQVQDVGCRPDKITVLPQGLSLDDFPFVPHRAPEKNEKLTLLTVARYQTDKGQQYALLALRRLRDIGIDAIWNFVGDGPNLAYLKDLSKKYQLENFVFFHTALDLPALRSLYHSSHLFVLPSLSARKKGDGVETQGVVLLEAQASGCIPIATNVGGIPECLHDKKDSILVRDRSSRAIAEAIIYLLERPEEWSRYQENGRRNVEQNFSAEVIGKKMAALLRKCAADKAV